MLEVLIDNKVSLFWVAFQFHAPPFHHLHLYLLTTLFFFGFCGCSLIRICFQLSKGVSFMKLSVSAFCGMRSSYPIFYCLSIWSISLTANQVFITSKQPLEKKLLMLHLLLGDVHGEMVLKARNASSIFFSSGLSTC